MNDRRPAWQQLGEHTDTLLAIRNSLFGQFERDGYFSDELVAKQPADKRPTLLAPLAFGAEGVVIPLGLFSYIARVLDEEQGYQRLKQVMMASDSVLARFTIEAVKNTKEAKRFSDLFQKAFPLLCKFSFEAADSQLAPYAEQDVLDLDCWILAALVDLDDLFFMGSSDFDRKVSRTQRQHHERAIDVLSNALGELQVLLNLNYPSGLNRRGWFGNLDIMNALGDLPTRATEQKSLREKLHGLPAGGKRDDWLAFVEKVLSHPNIVETTLVTTRAVLTFIVVAESAYREQTDGAEPSTDTLGPLLDFFDTAGNEIFRGKPFAAFVLREFTRLANLELIPPEDYDAFIHTIGILSFAVTRGYFAEGDDPEQFREDVRKLVPSRTELVNGILTAIEGSFEGALVKSGSFVEDPNWFVATKDWALLFDDAVTPLVRSTPVAKSELTDKHSFQFILALPLVVKALANISFEERLRLMRKRPAEEWRRIGWPPWLARVDAMADRLTRAMVSKHLRAEESGLIGVSKGAVDLCVTAGVVDALSLWCAALMLKSVADGELEPEDEGPGPTGTTLDGLAAEDIAAVTGFFHLLRRWTGGPATEATAPETDQIETLPVGMLPSENEWFHVLWQVLYACFDVLRDDYKWSSDARPATTRIEFPQVLELVGQIRFLQRWAPEGAGDGIVRRVLDLLRAMLVDAKTEFPAILIELRGRLRQEYPAIYERAARDAAAKEKASARK